MILDIIESIILILKNPSNICWALTRRSFPRKLSAEKTERRINNNGINEIGGNMTDDWNKKTTDEKLEDIIDSIEHVSSKIDELESRISGIESDTEDIKKLLNKLIK
jgi:hypothetical protein